MCNDGQERIEYTKTTLEQLIKLILNQDYVTAGWLQFSLAIESALYILYYYSINYLMEHQSSAYVINVLICSIPGLGIGIAVVLYYIVISERKWQGGYVQQAKLIPANLHRIYSPDKKTTSARFIEWMISPGARSGWA